jgi:hypothetical protein
LLAPEAIIERAKQRGTTRRARRDHARHPRHGLVWGQAVLPAVVSTGRTWDGAAPSLSSIRCPSYPIARKGTRLTLCVTHRSRRRRRRPPRAESARSAGG